MKKIMQHLKHNCGSTKINKLVIRKDFHFKLGVQLDVT